MRVCPLCGKIIQYTHVIEDGTDWEGHHRGQSSSYDIGYDCGCTTDNWKKMCLNCEYNVNDVCTNEEVRDEFEKKYNEESPFKVTIEKMDITHGNTHCCSKWKLSNSLIETLFNNGLN